MFRKITPWIAMVLCAAMLLTPAYAAENTLSQQIRQTSNGLSTKDCDAGTLLEMGEDFPAGTSACDWVAMALALSGSRENYEAYLSALQKYVEDCYAKMGKLDRVKSTTYHRIALTVMALGGNSRSFGAKPDGTAIDLIAEGTYAFEGESIGAQGLNGWIYALLTLDASKAQTPQNARFTREDMIQAIVSAQEPDGGFGLAAGSSNIDITAMALQALAPYADDHAQVIESGLHYLSNAMNEECLYTFYGDESAESSAQVVLALCALGIDPDEDIRFTKGEHSLLSGLARFRREDGTYGHTLSDEQGDYLATAQTLLALLALQKMRDGEGWIFDFTGHALPQPEENHTKYWIAIAVTMAATAAVACVIIIRKRKQYGKNNG